MPFPAPHIHVPTTPHTHTVIFLHGRGSSGEEFASDLFELRTSTGASLLEIFPGWKWVFPSAPARYSTVFQEEMSEWFDVYSLTDPEEEKELQAEGLREAVGFVGGIVEEEVRRLGGGEEGIGRVVLGGISQGEATALSSLLCKGWRVGAFWGLSGWLPFASEVEGFLRGGERGIDGVGKFLGGRLCIEGSFGRYGGIEEGFHVPLFLGHGADDAYVDVSLGRRVREILLDLGLLVTWKEYEGAEEEGNWVKEPEELDDFVAFLQEEVAALERTPS
jgi:lysophospholipase-2